MAFLAALCLKRFYRYTSDSRLEIDAKSIVLGGQAPGLNDTAIANAVDVRAAAAGIGRALGRLLAYDTDSRDALFAHCVALSITAVHESWNRRPRAPIVLWRPSALMSRRRCDQGSYSASGA